jgi:RNA-directed DNA polymerase
MHLDWFRPRGYKHFDAPVGDNFALRALDPAFVEKHSWLPLIHYTKRVKRYKPDDGQTVFKDRPIMYASHRDACILARYSAELTRRLDEYYEQVGLSENVIAYRKLGRSNYDFAADAYRFAQNQAPCVVLCFDITGFFDHLNHRILKDRLKRILDVSELPTDWYRVFRHVTHHSVISVTSWQRIPFLDRV